MDLTLGKMRRLQQAASNRGTFTVLAIDHRGPLRRRLEREPGVGNVDDALADVKRDIVRALASASTAVLLDPEFGLGACIPTGALPGNIGLLIALDTGSTGDPAVLKTGLVEGWDPARMARVGGSGVKLLVYYHPESPNAEEVEALVARVAAQCEQAEIPLYLEPLSFDPTDPSRPLSSGRRRAVVVETARRLTPLGVDILKAEFPVNAVEQADEASWREACEELTANSRVPWVLLSAGVSLPVFVRQTAVACAAGASGVIAGRALWNEAVTVDIDRRRRFLESDAQARLAEVRSICEQTGRSCFR
ncbi:MAG: tagatose 1,6-diphosphate aldolase [Verrucomicrobiales bacterium]|nr:tagatose 1,6-diphosphate aldolase [Verrucomicrobiales bacterium]